MVDGVGFRIGFAQAGSGTVGHGVLLVRNDIDLVLQSSTSPSSHTS